MLTILLAMVLLSSCQSTQSAKEPEVQEESFPYSLNTLIISVSGKDDMDAINAVFDKYGLEVLYDYENFPMFAVQIDHTCTPEELEVLITEIEKEELVIGVEKDYIYSIDSTDSNPNVDFSVSLCFGFPLD